MSLLRFSVLGSPEIVHNGTRLTFPLRKAQALLLYLAVEGGMHSRDKLAAFFWPDSSPYGARKALRNALTLLRHLLADAQRQEPHLHIEGDTLGLDPHASLDLDEVEHVYQQIQQVSLILAEPQRSTFASQVQHALSFVRGPFLDGFWLHRNAPFDEWHEQQQRQWHVRLLFLLDRLSFWHEEAGELQAAISILQRWLVLDPLSEEAFRRLMRVHLARGDVSTALQVYATCRTRLAEELQVQPSRETTDVAEHIRAIQVRQRDSHDIATYLIRVESDVSGDLRIPLIGRDAAFIQLSRSYARIQQAQPQGMLVVGEAGIGKTRLIGEFVTWATAQGAEVLQGHTLERGQLPFQLLVDAIRPRVEQENAPEDLLDDLWLSELSRLLPELRVRYPDLPVPKRDELTGKAHLFEAVAQLLHALEHRSPVVVVLDDLHWADDASFEVLHYLARSWISRGSRILLVGTVRSDEMERNAPLAARLTEVGRQLPVTQVALHSLSQTETLQLVRTFLGMSKQHTESRRKPHGPDGAQRALIGSETTPAQGRARQVVRLGEVLFAHTAGHPFYLLEMLKLLRDRHWLIPHLEMDGSWTLEQTTGMEEVLSKMVARGELLPSSVQSLIQGLLMKLSPVTQQLVQVWAVLGGMVSATLLWQVTEVEEQTGVMALEEAIGAGIVQAEEDRVGHPVRYRFVHELLREAVYTKMSVARRQVLHRRALILLQHECLHAPELAYHALQAGEVEVAYRFSVQAGMEAVALFAVKDALRHYEQARTLLQEHQKLQTKVSVVEVEHLYIHLGQVYTSLNAWEQAQETYAELLAYARQHHLSRLVSITLNRMAILVIQQRPVDKYPAQALLEEARQIAQSSHDQKALAETEWNRAQIMLSTWQESTDGLLHATQALSLARTLHDQELEARSLCLLALIHFYAGDFEEVMRCAEASLARYVRLDSEQDASQELALTTFMLGVPLTQSLTHLAAEALCWSLQATVQLQMGHVRDSIQSGRRALALAQESKSDLIQIISTLGLTYGLLDAGMYEEVLALVQSILDVGRIILPARTFLFVLVVLGRAYCAFHLWEEAQRTLEEAVVVARIDQRPFTVLPLSQLCMHFALAREWEQAHMYVMHAISTRQRFGNALILFDFSLHFEIEALLRAGDERRAREEVQRLKDRMGSNRRFHLPYLRSLALLAEWEGRSEQALDALHEAAVLAADLGIPEEQWQIQAVLGTVYEERGEREQAHTAFGEAKGIIQRLAEGIRNEGLRTAYVMARQIQQVVQHVNDDAL